MGKYFMYQEKNQGTEQNELFDEPVSIYKDIVNSPDIKGRTASGGNPTEFLPGFQGVELQGVKRFHRIPPVLHVKRFAYLKNLSCMAIIMLR